MFDNQPSHGCNGFADLCCSSLMWVIFGATGLLLFFSLTCNILCFARTYRKDHSSKFLPRFRRSFSFKSKEVEDPVYGNINYIYTGLERHSNGQSEGPKTGLKGNTPRQICYAKLELPASRDQQGRRLTKTQYAETLNMLKKSRVDRKAQQGVLENQANTTLSRTLPKFPDSQDLEPSEFYASVRLGKPDSTARSEQYANNESLKI